MPNLTFQYPAWLLIVCVLLGLGYALLLYYRDTTFRERAKQLNRWLGLLRFVVVTLLSALLLSPLLKRTLTETQKPVVVLAQDQSESAGTAIGAGLEAYKQDWQRLRDALGEDYDVREIAFGDAVRDQTEWVFQDKVSNISELFQGIYDRFGAQNLGAVVLATDGIYNEGSNPLYNSAPINAPVYTIALGDTTPRKDLLLKRVFHNKIAYLGDKFSVQVDIAATNCAGGQTILSISKINADGVRSLQNIPILVAGNDFFTTKEIVLEADQAGVAQYVFSLNKLPGEATEANNSKEIFIDVLDARQKILLLAYSPHPDLSAIRQTLETNKNYQVSIAYINDPGLDAGKYDFVILHNLPSANNDIGGLLKTLDDKRIPRLFIAGLQAGYPALAKAQGLVSIQGVGQQSDDVQGKVSPQFAAFSIDPRIAQELPKFNPLNSAFGTFGATPQAQVVLWKRIGKIDTDQPLLAVGESNGIKTGVWMAEGLWRWRLFDFLQHNNHEIFDELVGKTVQFLSLKEDKRKFRVNIDKAIFNENEPVVFDAELYNDNYELVNEPDVSLSVFNADNREFTYQFNKLGKAYTLSAGILPTGNYRYKASTNFNGQALSYEGRFSVRPIQLEMFDLVANHGMLRQLSAQYGGVCLGADSLGTVVERIKANKLVKPLMYQTAKTSPLINLKWIFALLAGMLALEWFLRRYYGAY